MNILIEKDSATKVPRQVVDLEEAKAIAAQGFHVTVEVDGAYVPLAALEPAEDETADVAESEAPPVAAAPAPKKAPAKKTAKR